MDLWLAKQPLVLASQSKVRRAVLEAAGIPIEVSAADLDERAIERHHIASGPAADASAIAMLLAREKALTVGRKFPGRVIVGADQTLALGAARLSKPPNREAAAHQLRALRGRTHALYSAVAVIRGDEILFSHVAVAAMTVREFSEDFLTGYLQAVGDAALHSVGGYQLEGIGSQLFSRVDGDYFTVLGLPLLPLLEYLRRAGWLAS